MTSGSSAFLEGVVRTATPLALAALGETVTERSGVINIGLEGSIIAGALGAVIGAGHGGVWAGFLFGAACGCAVAAIFALFAVTLRTDQIISGTAVTLLALGGTGTLYRVLYGSAGAALNTPTLEPTRIPLLAQIPLIGSALFAPP